MTTINPKKLALAILGPAALVAGMAVGARAAILKKKAADLAIKDAALREDPAVSAPDEKNDLDAADTLAKGTDTQGEFSADEAVAPEEAFEADDLTTAE